jgi:hypothetical protein
MKLVYGASEENAVHIIFQCPFASDFWNKVGLMLPPGASIMHVHRMQKIQQLPQLQYSMFFALCFPWRECFFPSTSNILCFGCKTMALQNTKETKTSV